MGLCGADEKGWRFEELSSGGIVGVDLSFVLLTFREKSLFTTRGNSPLMYSLVGVALIFGVLPASVVDILLDPQWHAPNWQCDSVGIPIMFAINATPVWALISMFLGVGIAYPAARGASGRGRALDLAYCNRPVWWLVTIPVIVLCTALGWDVIRHFWMAIVPQTIIADCNGRAEAVTLVRRGPIFQTIPVFEAGIALWLLHLRRLAIWPREIS